MPGLVRSYCSVRVGTKCGRGHREIREISDSDGDYVAHRFVGRGHILSRCTCVSTIKISPSVVADGRGRARHVLTAPRRPYTTLYYISNLGTEGIPCCRSRILTRLHAASLSNWIEVAMQLSCHAASHLCSLRQGTDGRKTYDTIRSIH